MNYHFEPHARQELKDATVYYNNLNPALGDAFARESKLETLPSDRFRPSITMLEELLRSLQVNPTLSK
jgi:hypothetical protein